MDYREINALIPCYDAYGKNIAQLYLENRTSQYTSCALKQYFIKMFYDYHLDRKAVQYWTQKTLGNKLNNPIVIDEKLIFFPVKMRKAVARHDGNFAYINWKAVKEFSEEGIEFENGDKIGTLSTNGYIQRKLNESRLLSYVYNEYKKRTWLIW